MHIQRTQRRAYWPLAGCLLVALSCLAITTVAALLLLPALPGLALRIAGFQPQGSTADFFEAQSPAPAIIANRAAPPVQAVLDLGIYGREPLSGIGYAYALETGTDASGAPVASLTLPEATLMTLCQERSAFCASGDDQIRSARIDLQPGGAIIYADVFVPQLATWQSLGMVVQTANNRLDVVGIDVNGTLYQPEASDYAALMTNLESTANDALTQLALIADGTRYALQAIHIDDQTLTLVLR